jgi:hypothetical protein
MGIFVAISEMMALEDEKPAGFVASGLQYLARSHNELSVQGSQYIRGDL